MSNEPVLDSDVKQRIKDIFLFNDISVTYTRDGVTAYLYQVHHFESLLNKTYASLRLSYRFEHEDGAMHVYGPLLTIHAEVEQKLIAGDEHTVTTVPAETGKALNAMSRAGDAAREIGAYLDSIGERDEEGRWKIRREQLAEVQSD